jgi:hypothetical protein
MDAPAIWHRHLRRGEVVVWTGDPKKRFVVAWMLVNLAGAAIFALLTWKEFNDRFLSGIGSANTGGKTAIVFPLFAGLTVWSAVTLAAYLLGFYRQHYAITNKRALVLTHFVFDWLKTRDLGLAYPERSAFYSSIQFGRYRFPWGLYPMWFFGIDDPAFEAIQEAIGKTKVIGAEAGREGWTSQ